MSYPKELKELTDLVRRIDGAVYSYMGRTYLAPDHATVDSVPEHGIVRCGFKLYEIISWNQSHSAWEVRPFKAALNDEDLMKLSEQAK